MAGAATVLMRVASRTPVDNVNTAISPAATPAADVRSQAVAVGAPAATVVARLSTWFEPNPALMNLPTFEMVPRLPDGSHMMLDRLNDWVGRRGRDCC